MIGNYEVSVDKMTYTFTLRDGLFWHDGQPVTADDCIASIKRWAAKDLTGQKLMSFVIGMEAKGAKTFVMKLNEPTGTGFKVDMQSMDWQTLVARRARETCPLPVVGTRVPPHE